MLIYLKKDKCFSINICSAGIFHVFQLNPSLIYTCIMIISKRYIQYVAFHIYTMMFVCIKIGLILQNTHF